MSTKTLVWIGVLVGSVIGGWIPELFGQSFLSMASLLGSGVGSIVGIWLGIKIGDSLS